MFFYDIVGSGGRRLGQVTVLAGCVERGIDDESPASHIDHRGGPAQHGEGEVTPCRIHGSHVRPNRSWCTHYSGRNQLRRAVRPRLGWCAVTVQPAQRWRQILRDALLDAAEVARRDLSDDQIRGLLRTDVDERLAAADEVGAGGRTNAPPPLPAEAVLLNDLLGDV
jgi:hypothetical protein